MVIFCIFSSSPQPGELPCKNVTVITVVLKSVELFASSSYPSGLTNE